MERLLPGLVIQKRFELRKPDLGPINLITMSMPLTLFSHAIHSYLTAWNTSQTLATYFLHLACESFFGDKCAVFISS